MSCRLRWCSLESNWCIMFKTFFPILPSHTQDLQKWELSWPLGGGICLLLNELSRNCLSLVTEPAWPWLVTASIRGKYSSWMSRMSFQNWTWYCFIRALPQTSRKSKRSVAVTSARGSMFSIWASQRQPLFSPCGSGWRGGHIMIIKVSLITVYNWGGVSEVFWHS